MLYGVVAFFHQRREDPKAEVVHNVFGNPMYTANEVVGDASLYAEAAIGETYDGQDVAGGEGFYADVAASSAGKDQDAYLSVGTNEEDINGFA